MNIKKTNPLGVALVEGRFGDAYKAVKTAISEKEKEINGQDLQEFGEKNKEEMHLINLATLHSKPDMKVMRLSKQVVENCKLINIDGIKGNLDASDFGFESIAILLDKDETGIIKIDRFGSDFTFLFIQNLRFQRETYFNSYSFLTKEFLFPEGKDKALFVVKVLAYLYYGDITERYIPAKTEVKISSFSKILNNAKFPITYVDSLWKQRISTDGFKVSGHFRLQPIGEGRAKRKLIWIEEYEKDGYNRKATREL